MLVVHAYQFVTLLPQLLCVRTTVPTQIASTVNLGEHERALVARAEESFWKAIGALVAVPIVFVGLFVL